MENHRFLSKQRETSLEIDRLLQIAEVKPEAKLLDFGCGPGLFMDYYMSNSVMDVVGVDIDQEYIDYCTQMYPMYLFTSEVPEDKYDNIIMSNVYHHLENGFDVVSDLISHLEVNGVLTIIEFKKKVLDFGPSVDHKIDKKTLKAELSELNLVEELDYNEYYYILKYRQ